MDSKNQKLGTLRKNIPPQDQSIDRPQTVVMSDSASDKSDGESAKGKSKDAVKKNVTFSPNTALQLSSSSSHQNSSSFSSNDTSCTSQSTAASSTFSVSTISSSSNPLKLKIISPQQSSTIKSNTPMTASQSSGTSQTVASDVRTSNPSCALTTAASITTDQKSESTPSTKPPNEAPNSDQSSSTDGAACSSSSAESSKQCSMYTESLSDTTESQNVPKMEIKQEDMIKNELCSNPSSNPASGSGLENVPIKSEITDLEGKPVVTAEELEESEKDMTTPLSIETKFMTCLPSAPSSESTDTASEIGSTFSSPGSFANSSCQSSPQFSDSNTNSDGRSDKVEERHSHSHNLENHRKRRASQTFTPKDLVDLLKNVEHEIESCQQILKEENEKRKKYKIDACRRTHNYDQFIVTFLSMLAEQGHLGTLMEQNMSIKKPPSSTGAVGGKITKKSLLSNKKSKGKLKKKGKK